MRFAHSDALITGATGGLGLALVSVLLERGAKRVYAACREPQRLVHLVDREPRLVPLAMDVLEGESITRARETMPSLDVVINNAGIMSSFSLLSGPLENVRNDWDVNFLGPLRVARAFLPALEKGEGRTLVNVLSMAALASMPSLGGYCASKAAALSMTQALRGELLARQIRVVGVLAGPMDTPMIRSLDIPKASPRDVAAAIVDGIERGEEDITPDPISRDVYQQWKVNPKAIEARFGARR